MTKHQTIPVLPVQDRIRGCLIGGAAGDAPSEPYDPIKRASAVPVWHCGCFFHASGHAHAPSGCAQARSS